MKQLPELHDVKGIWNKAYPHIDADAFLEGTFCDWFCIRKESNHACVIFTAHPDILKSIAELAAKKGK